MACIGPPGVRSLAYALYGWKGLGKRIQPRQHDVRCQAQRVSWGLCAIDPCHLQSICLGSHDIEGVGRDEDDGLFGQAQSLGCQRVDPRVRLVALDAVGTEEVRELSSQAT